jgi:transcriptional regulator with XRE-family HTH domain
VGGNNLADYRRKKDLSLFEAAKQLGAKASDVSSWEHERAIPSANQVQDLAAVYGCTVAEIEATLPDLERVQAEETRFARLMGVMVAAKRESKRQGFGVGKGGRFSFPCPKCETGTVSCSTAAVNGHTWGRCSTEGCAAWME